MSLKRFAYLDVDSRSLVRKQRQSIRAYVGRSKTKTRVEKIFALLVESGLIYCLTQVWLSLRYSRI